MIQKISGKTLGQTENILNVNSDLVILENTKICDFDKVKIVGCCKVIMIFDTYFGGNAKKIIKKLRDEDEETLVKKLSLESDDENEDKELEYYDEHYCFDLTELNGLEIAVDAIDRMSNDYMPKAECIKYGDKVKIIIDNDGDKLYDFVKKLKQGKIKTTLSKDDINYIYKTYS